MLDKSYAVAIFIDIGECVFVCLWWHNDVNFVSTRTNDNNKN